MKRYSLIFSKPEKIEIKKENISKPKDNQVLIKTSYSSISTGTELLFYKNQINKKLLLDKNINNLKKTFKHPFKYGYSTVGKIISTGNKVPSKWQNQIVFVFHPHENYFLATVDELIPIPKYIKPIEATFFPSMETAVNFVMDGSPLIGENVLIYGQGIIGLLTTYLHSKFPLNKIITVEKHEKRRKKSIELGADKSITNTENPTNYFDNNLGADLVYELSGNSDLIEPAIKNIRYNGRIIIGSFYGKRKTTISLDEKFHRNRIQIISSQVSTINPKYLGRWNKNRRIDLCWKLINDLKTERLISHKISFENASDAYELLDKHLGETLQTILVY